MTEFIGTEEGRQRRRDLEHYGSVIGEAENGTPVNLHARIKPFLDELTFNLIASAISLPLRSIQIQIKKESDRLYAAAHLAAPVCSDEAGSPTLYIQVCHQPNLFAGLNVLSLPTILADALTIVPELDRFAILFRSNDYDVAGDRRFRVGLIAQPSARPVIITGAIPRRMRNCVAYLLPPPSQVMVEGLA